MKKIFFWILSGGAVVSIIILGIIYFRYFQGIGPALNPPVGDIADLIEKATTASSTNDTNLPLKLPPGFSISIFAKNLPGSRVMALTSYGTMYVSQTSLGKVSILTTENGKAVQKTLFKNLNKPHGLVVDEEELTLYIAEEDKISRSSLASELFIADIIDLPKGGRHFTRTLGFGPDKRLYVSIGSTCDTCYEKDPRHAAVYSFDPNQENVNESDLRLFAKGLRNSVFFTWHPETKKMWATEMGRDFLGDNLPPEEINILEEGKNYGWPVCYGKNIQDTKFDPKQYTVSPCNDKVPSYIDMPAHSAPLGLAFVPAQSTWPKEYWHNLLVAYHGSWNKSQPDGYKIVRIKLDKEGNYLGTEDFISGWLTPKGAFGRPVDILIHHDGTMYVSDDKAGVIYRITYQNS